MVSCAGGRRPIGSKDAGATFGSNGMVVPSFRTCLECVKLGFDLDVSDSEHLVDRHSDSFELTSIKCDLDGRTAGTWLHTMFEE